MSHWISPPHSHKKGQTARSFKTINYKFMGWCEERRGGGGGGGGGGKNKEQKQTFK